MYCLAPEKNDALYMNLIYLAISVSFYEFIKVVC